MALLRSLRRLLQLRDFSPFVRAELRFDKFPRHPGGGRTLAALVGSNVCVWVAWETAESKALSGDERMLAFMGHHFVGTNQGMSELQNLHRIFLSSFSHQDFGHLLGNMTALLLMGPRLHEFLGRARFLMLYAAGAMGGTLATQWLHLDPAWEARCVREMPKRYYNILGNLKPGEAIGLGASDAISALFACFYLLFPRQPVPFLWMKTNVAWALLPKAIQSRVPVMGTVMRRTQAAAIWVLPMFFFVDFVQVWTRLVGSKAYETGLLPTSNTGHAAHVGGFLAGASFYALVAHALKAKYFHFTREEMLRRAYLMALSLSSWYLLTRKLKGWSDEEKTADAQKAVFFLAYRPDKEEKKSNSSKAHRDLEHAWESDHHMRSLISKANYCSVRESCSKDPADGQSGVCDEHFTALRRHLERISTAPSSMATLLAPEFVDSVKMCRTVLREFDADDALRDEVHGGYRKVSPAINDVEINLVPWSLPMLIRAVAPSFFRGSVVQDAGLVLAETSGEVRLASVRGGSAAERVGAGAHIGHAVTHVNANAVSTIKEVHQAIRFSARAHFWLEERSVEGQPQAAEAAGRAGSLSVADLRRLGLRAVAP
mmetsp:Transcript_158292/g.484985  ORF Transcript_158292/g.484985 Transcript_158292/m.484985 type:complete len:600 (-) Transcript_158292:38-1837(-)